MNGIMGFLELLKDMDLSPEERNMYISFVNKSGQRLMNTINDIIEMSKIETGSMQINNESFSLLEMMEYLFTVFDEKAKEKKIDFSIKLNEELKTLILHNDRIRLQVILNSLISNAIKFTTAGKVEFGCTKEMDLLKFYVLDTGSGIPEARLEHVFVRFFQSEDNLSRSHEGSGLGLSIAKAYAELLGGHIKVESEVNKGSVFSVYLPL
jgi:signal transduction histidine kinase